MRNIGNAGGYAHLVHTYTAATSASAQVASVPRPLSIASDDTSGTASTISSRIAAHPYRLLAAFAGVCLLVVAIVAVIVIEEVTHTSGTVVACVCAMYARRQPQRQSTNHSHLNR